MSRPSALRETLKLPSAHALAVVSVAPSGDCFYECIHALLDQHHAKSPSSSVATSPLWRSGDGAAVVPSAQRLRRHVAGRLSSTQLDLYKMYAAAGLEEYDFSTTLVAVRDLQRFAERSGKAHGPGKCLWADEFALRSISEALRLTLWIIDDQAARGASRSAGGKRRRNDAGRPPASSPKADQRFVSIGEYPHVVILHRSRRQHFNAVVIDDLPVMELARLPSNVRSLWPEIKSEQGGVDSTCCAGSDLGGNHEKESCEEKEERGENLSLEKCEPATFPDANNASATASSPMHALGDFYCGCAGFAVPAWVGNFYPQSLVGHNSERQLEHYQRHLRAVEINSTFYGIPAEATVLKWKKIIAKTFKVVAKAPKGLTHESPQLDGSVLSAFLSRVRPLGDTLACILIQCPRTLAVTVSQLERLRTILDEEAGWYKGQIACEFRNSAVYFDEAIRQCMAQNNFTLVMHPDSLGRSTVGTSASSRGSGDLVEYPPEQLSKVATGAVVSSFVYLRLHGFNDEHSGEYSLDQLTEIADQIHLWRRQGREVFCFFLNDLAPTPPPSLRKKEASQPWDRWCAMPKNAKQLESLVFGMSRETIPDAPKKQKRTLLNFFRKKGP